MNAESLLRDPGFQLNLLIWMAKEQPSAGYVVKPVFYENGFVIVYVENPFPLPPETEVQAGSSGLDISIKPEPEVILRRERDLKALYFECKASSFSPTSTTSRQARGHLLAAGPAFAEFAPGHRCLLCYVIPEKDRDPMGACLVQLAKELSGNALRPGPTSVHGLGLEEDKVRYSWDDGFKNHVGAQVYSEIVLENVTNDTDPSPLFLVFSPDDYPDPKRQDLYRQAFLQRVHAVLLCDLHRYPSTADYETTTDQLLDRTTDGVFKYCGRGRQRAMRLLVRERMFNPIFNQWRGEVPETVVIEGNSIRALSGTPKKREAFMQWLETWRQDGLEKSRPPDGQLSLFHSEFS